MHYTNLLGETNAAAREFITCSGSEDCGYNANGSDSNARSVSG